ncbi:MAG: zinc ribbon-containing protein [Cycloclasticus sp.]
MNNPIQDKLLHAYDAMMERLHDTVEKAEKLAIPTIDQNLQQAKEKAVELGELTREEANKVSGYLKRDIDDISAYLQETQEEFSEWLSFESTLIEGKIGDWLNLVADNTKLQWDKLSLDAIKAQLYHSGEVTGPGTLECVACEQTLNFKKTGHIPPCPKCHKTEFKRHSKKASNT